MNDLSFIKAKSEVLAIADQVEVIAATGVSANTSLDLLYFRLEKIKQALLVDLRSPFCDQPDIFERNKL